MLDKRTELLWYITLWPEPFCEIRSQHFIKSQWPLLYLQRAHWAEELMRNIRWACAQVTMCHFDTIFFYKNAIILTLFPSGPIFSVLINWISVGWAIKLCFNVRIKSQMKKIIKIFSWTSFFFSTIINKISRIQ